MSFKLSRFTADSERLGNKLASSNANSSDGGAPTYARHDELAVTEFRINLDPANGGLPMVDMGRTTLGFREVVALLRDGVLGSTELPPKQYE